MTEAGVLVPLFSIPSRRSWGIGEIPDLVPLSAWLTRAGLTFAQLLPLNEMEEGRHSPYAAQSAMAIDPIFIAMDDVADFHAAGSESCLPLDARAALEDARAATAIDYRAVRAAKTAALRAAFAAFDAHAAGQAERHTRFHTFVERERWWLEDYTLFRALHEENGGRYWREWEEGVRDRRRDALEAARARLADAIRYHAYVQWIAGEQWTNTRRACSGIAMVGDFPFMVSGHSADVWARQHEFRLDASVGTPPDGPAQTPQDWGLPAYRWDVAARGDYTWLRERAARCAALFDGFRVDHLVGFYRTFVIERDGRGAFVPVDEDAQLAQGELVVRLLRSAGARIVAEDLGVVPDFVRESLARLAVPGLKVLRWERHWHEPERPFRNPADYPPESMATTGTHDTSTLAAWWAEADSEERRRCAEAPAMRAAGLSAESPFSAEVRDAFLRVMFSAGSRLLLLPVQDVFGWADRINDPAAEERANWSWRLPWPADDLLTEPEPLERADFLRSLASRTSPSSFFLPRSSL